MEAELKTELVEDAVQALQAALLPDATPPDPRFDFNGLAGHSQRLGGALWGLLARLDVPAGMWAILYLPGEAPQTLAAGTYWLRGARSSSAQVQWVDASRRRLSLPPVSGISSDGWQITLRLDMLYQVVQPTVIAAVREPLAALAAAARAAALAEIETLAHGILLGLDKTAQVALTSTEDAHSGEAASTAGGPEAMPTGPSGSPLDRLGQALLARLNQRPGLDGLQVVDVLIVERSGDPRLLNLLQGEALARLKAIETGQTAVIQAGLEKLQQERQLQSTQAERAVALVQAEMQAQLAALTEQQRILQARTEAQVQEIRQAQEAREAERRRLAEEWRTAKELDLRSMEYQHAETLAVIQGTSQVSIEAAKNGSLAALQTANRRVEMGGEAAPDAVAAGIQALRGFREKIAAPTTHFLPRPMAGELAAPGVNTRLEEESLRLERLAGVEHELTLRRGQLSGARLWFNDQAPAALAGVTLVFTCPEEYPFLPPQVEVRRGDTVQPYPLAGSWDERLYLADLGREIWLALALEEENHV